MSAIALCLPVSAWLAGCAGLWLLLPSLLCWVLLSESSFPFPSVFSIPDALAELLNMEARLEIIPCSNGRAASSPALLEEVRLPWCSCFARQCFCHCFFPLFAICQLFNPPHLSLWMAHRSQCAPPGFYRTDNKLLSLSPSWLRSTDPLRTHWDPLLGSLCMPTSCSACL